MKITIPQSEVDKVVSKFFYLAWKASSVLGMGFLQDRPSATEKDVFNNVIGSGDYAMPIHGAGNRTYADYVFGRMMKVGIKVVPNGESFDLEVSDDPARIDYQSWARTYKTAADVLKAAIA